MWLGRKDRGLCTPTRGACDSVTTLITGAKEPWSPSPQVSPSSPSFLLNSDRFCCICGGKWVYLSFRSWKLGTTWESGRVFMGPGWHRQSPSAPRLYSQGSMGIPATLAARVPLSPLFLSLTGLRLRWYWGCCQEPFIVWDLIMFVTMWQLVCLLGPRDSSHCLFRWVLPFPILNVLRGTLSYPNQDSL